MLHGPFEPETTSRTFEKFWTTFTFEYETSYLSPSRPLLLSQPTTLTLPLPQAGQVQRALLSLSNTSALPLLNLGIISSSGNGTLDKCPDVLLRYLDKVLSGSLSNPRTKSSPSSPIKQSGDRKTSWTGLGSLSWVPGLGGSRGSTPSRSTGYTGSPRSRETSSPSRLSVRTVDSGRSTADTVIDDKHADKWGFMGLAGLTDAVGSLKVAPSLDVGSLFRFGHGPASDDNVAKQTGEPDVDFSAGESGAQGGSMNKAIETSHGDGDTLTASPIRPSLEVAPRPGLLPDLEAASTHKIDLGWESKTVYLNTSHSTDTSDPSLTAHTLWWIIRDGILLFALTSAEETPSISSESVSTFYASLSVSSAVSGPEKAETDGQWLFSSLNGVSTSTPALTRHAEGTLLKFEDWSEFEPSLEEVSAKTSKEFIGWKRYDKGDEDGKESLFLSLDGKDTSLTDVDREWSILTCTDGQTP